MNMDMIKDKIMETAIALYSKAGYQSIPFDEIACESGLEEPVFFSCFPSQEELRRHLLAYITRRMTHYELTKARLVELLASYTPEEILQDIMVYYNEKGNDVFMMALRRLLYIERFSHDAELAQVAERHLVDIPTRLIAQALKWMAQLGVIPPCDHLALSELWSRTTRIYGILATHEDNCVSGEEYYAMIAFFVQIAVRGVQPFPVEQLQMEWTHAFSGHDLDLEHLDSRQKVLLTALDLFSQRGYQGVSYEEIAQKAREQGLVLEEHFPTKNKIVWETSKWLMTGFQKLKEQAHGTIFQAQRYKENPQRIILTLSSSYPPIQEKHVAKLYRVLFREQYNDEILKDYFVGSIYRDQYAIEEALNHFIASSRLPPCESEKIAVAYVYTMVSLTLSETLFHSSRETLEQLRIRCVALLVSLILNGYTQ